MTSFASLPPGSVAVGPTPRRRVVEEDSVEEETEGTAVKRGLLKKDNAPADEGDTMATVEREPLIDADEFFEMSIDDMMDTLGVSGKIICSLPNEEIWETVWLATQAFIFQYVILAYIYRSLVPLPEGTSKDLPLPILFGAIYLHITSCIMDFPLCALVLMHFNELKNRYFLYEMMPEDREESEYKGLEEVEAYMEENNGKLPENVGKFMYPNGKIMVTSYVYFLMDAFITPTFTTILGGLYLCTSQTSDDVILNSCAVCFVTSIDNYILGLFGKLSDMSGAVTDGTVKIPYHKGCTRAFQWVLLDLPVVPLGLTVGIMWYGLTVMRL
jgi:hypothetical protein